MKKVIILLVVLMGALTTYAQQPINRSSQNKTDTIKIKYTCPMHPEVISNKPGKCPKCGMTLVNQKLTDGQKKMLKDRTYTKPKY